MWERMATPEEAWLDQHDLSDFFEAARWARTDLERGTVVTRW